MSYVPDKIKNALRAGVSEHILKSAPPPEQNPVYAPALGCSWLLLAQLITGFCLFPLRSFPPPCLTLPERTHCRTQFITDRPFKFIHPGPCWTWYGSMVMQISYHHTFNYSVIYSQYVERRSSRLKRAC